MLSPDSKSFLSPLATHCKNRSLSSISAISEAASFYSAHDSSFGKTSNSLQNRNIKAEVLSPPKNNDSKINSQQKFSTPKMIRQDSGYADITETPLSCALETSKIDGSPRSRTSRKRRKSIKNTRHPCKQTRSFKHPDGLQRLEQYHRSPFLYEYNKSSCLNRQPNQLFGFPSVSFAEAESGSFKRSDIDSSYSPQSPPPQTIHYWTSNSTRRLEYAAIDAASSGVRGFLARLVPDCVLPAEARRTKFWGQDDEKASNTGGREGSVRRYRLALPDDSDDEMEEKTTKKKGWNESKERKKGHGLLKRWIAHLGSN